MRTLLLLLLASLAIAADQRPLVLSTTTGTPVQIPAGNRLALPTASGGFYSTIDPGVQTATRVFTLPVTAAGDTFDVLGTAQTISAVKTFSAQWASSVATGTAPFTVASTTQVANLNASQLIGGTWAVPGTIGSTTPNTGAFTTLSASSASASPLTLTGGTVTASFPVWTASQTWNNAGVAFIGSYLNVTPTASAAGSYLMRLDNAGSPVFRVDVTGSNFINAPASANGTLQITSPNTGNTVIRGITTSICDWSQNFGAGSSNNYRLVDNVNSVTAWQVTGGAVSAGSFGLKYTTASSSTITGAYVVGDGATVATNVGIGGGVVNVGSRVGIGANSTLAYLNIENDNISIDAIRIKNTNVTNPHTWIIGPGAGGGASLNVYDSTNAATALTIANASGNLVTISGTSGFSVSSTTDASAIGTAGVVVSGGATFAKSIGLGSIAAPGSPFMGQIWNDSTRQGLMTFAGSSTANGVKECLPGVLFTVNASGGAGPIGSTSAVSLFPAGAGTKTLPANFLTLGKSLHIHMRGTLSNGGGGTLTVLVSLGGTTIATTGAVTPTGTLSGVYWEGDWIATCFVTGASGNVDCRGHIIYANGQTAQILPCTSSVTINTTTAQALDVTAQYSVSSASNSMQCIHANVEVLN